MEVLTIYRSLFPLATLIARETTPWKHSPFLPPPFTKSIQRAASEAVTKPGLAGPARRAGPGARRGRERSAVSAAASPSAAPRRHSSGKNSRLGRATSASHPCAAQLSITSYLDIIRDLSCQPGVARARSLVKQTDSAARSAKLLLVSRVSNIYVTFSPGALLKS